MAGAGAVSAKKRKERQAKIKAEREHLKRRSAFEEKVRRNVKRRRKKESRMRRNACG